MTIDDLITIQTQIARMELESKGLEKAAADARAELAATPGGYKATISKARVRDTEAALVAHNEKLASVKRELESQNETNAWFAARYASYTLALERLEAAKEAAGQQLTAALEEAKKGAWKFQGRKNPEEPSLVLRARKELVSINDSMLAVDKEYETTAKIIAELRAWDREELEFRQWCAGGPKPASVRRHQEAEMAEMMAGCVSLKLPVRGQPYTFNWPKPVVEKEVEPEPEEWIAMSAEEYLQSLMPKPVVYEEPVAFTPLQIKKTPTFFNRFIANRKARKEKSLIPRLVIQEIA